MPHVWLLDMSADWMDRLADSDVASEEERARARRMSASELERRLLARRSALRFVLGRYLDRPARAVRIVTAPGGKPVLLPGAVETDAGRPRPGGRSLPFSVAHADDLYGIAVERRGSVGLDMEGRRRVPRAEAIARRWFAEEETRRLEGLEGDALHAAFLRVWTGKEALAKRHGAGLRLMMRGDVGELDTVRAHASGRLRWGSPQSDCLVAVACSEPLKDLRFVVPEDGGWIP